MGRSKIYTYSAKRLENLRKRAQKASEIRHAYEIGRWSKKIEDPAEVLALFKTLSLKPGYTLRAYQYMEHAGGNGVVCAMPEDSPFPDPTELPGPPERLFDRPVPPGALDNVMDAIEAEDKPWSYVEASLFSAEMYEFGAYWHGLGWGMHTIIGDDFQLSDEWKWKGKQPDSFKPTVYVGPRVVRVTFYSYSSLGQESLFRHTDSYKKGRFRCTKSESRNIATGPLSMLM